MRVIFRKVDGLGNLDIPFRKHFSGIGGGCADQIRPCHAKFPGHAGQDFMPLGHGLSAPAVRICLGNRYRQLDVPVIRQAVSGDQGLVAGFADP